MKKIGYKIYFLMLEKGLNYSQMAKRCGLHRLTVSKHINDPEGMTLGELKRYAEVLEVDWRDILREAV